MVSGFLKTLKATAKFFETLKVLTVISMAA